ncbi:hypothetical protein [Micromonospora coxensis]|uniref:hypothetical protein n=1 Tax=Micromonospora coxensis TaxID=356852 RepID=UPI003446BBB3
MTVDANWDAIYARMTGRDRRDEDPILGALRRQDRERVAAELAARKAAETDPSTPEETH